MSQMEGPPCPLFPLSSSPPLSPSPPRPLSPPLLLLSFNSRPPCDRTDLMLRRLVNRSLTGGSRRVWRFPGAVAGRRCMSDVEEDGEGGASVSGTEPGSLWVWGSGALGFPAGTASGLNVLSRHHPTHLDAFNGKKIRKVTFGPGGGAAVTAGGALYTWGSEKYVLGHGPKVSTAQTPKRVRALKGIRIVDVAMGGFHAAALSDEGEVFTWGWGGSWFFRQGALGHGDTVDQYRPALVEALDREGVRVSQVACGNLHTLALSDEGQVYAFGEGEFGRLGTGLGSQKFPKLVEFPEPDTKVVQLAVGKDHSFALDSRGLVWGWGKNGQNQLGLHETMSVDVNACESMPQPLELLRGVDSEGQDIRVTQVNAGNRNGIVLTTNNKVFHWGDRSHIRPYEVPDWPGRLPGETIVQVAAGRGSWGALTSRGRVYTWGKNLLTGALGRKQLTGEGGPGLLEMDVAADRLFLAHKAGAIVVGTPPSHPPELPTEPEPARP